MTKTYKITEKGTSTEVQATSREKAAALFFGVAKPVRVMGLTKNEYANMKHKREHLSAYRSATVEIVEPAPAESFGVPRAS